MLTGKRSHSCGALALAVILGAVSPPSASGDPLREALEARKLANRAGAESQERIDELSDLTAALTREYRGTLDEIDALRIYNSRLSELVATQDEDAASLERQVQEVAGVGRALPPLMLKMVEALERFVDLDLPFLPQERAERIARLRATMARADVSDSEKYRRVLEAYQIENEYGRTIEAYQGSLDSDGRKRAVDFLRLGRVVLVYQTLEGSESGVWDARSGSWRKLGEEYRVAIAHGLRMARKQAAPDLITLPVAAAETPG